MNELSLDVTLMVVAVLDQLGVRYVLGGSLASAVHGVARATLDSDLIVDLRPEHVPPLVEGLQSDFYIVDEAAYEAIRYRSSFNLIHYESMFKVDIFVAKNRPFDDAQLEHGEFYTVSVDPARQIRITSAEDTLLAKLEWFRMGGGVSDRQWQDILGILRVQAGNLDRAYLQHMAKLLQVGELLEQAMRDAV